MQIRSGMMITILISKSNLINLRIVVIVVATAELDAVEVVVACTLDDINVATLHLFPCLRWLLMVWLYLTKLLFLCREINSLHS